MKYICSLLRSNKFSKEEKQQKKKKGHARKTSKTDTDSSKVLKSLMNCLPMLLNQPNRLKDLSRVTDIVEKLIQFSNSDNEEELSKSILHWTTQLESLSFGSYEDRF